MKDQIKSNSKMVRILSTGVVLTALSGCATLQNWQAEMTEQWNSENCNANAALVNGVNDATDGKRMNSNYAQSCPQTQVRKDGFNAKYAEGYVRGLKNRPQEVIIKKEA